MKKHLSRIVVIAILIGIAAFFYHRRLGEAPPVITAPPPVPPAATAPAVPPSAPPVRYPLAAAPPAANTTTHTLTATDKQVPSLPTLDHSDAAATEALGLLTGQPALDSLFRVKSLIRHVVVIVDNLPRHKLPQRDMPTRAVPGQFIVAGPDAQPHISPKNYARYSPYVHLFETVSLKDLVATYVRFYPLFQQAYVELGYPKRYFNDRLIAAIDNLLATPQVQGPVALVRPSVMYKFADPKLEALTAGQKVLIRMGPDNAKRVKTRLRALRKALLAQVTTSARAADGQ